jgi:hypothetical protein
MRKSTFTRLSVVALLVFGVTLSACSEEQPPATQSVQPTAAPVNESAALTPATALPPVTVPSGTTASTLSPEALETLLAPVALYPDAVLAQVLASSTNPQEVLDAGNWLVANPDTKGKELDAAATAAGFTPPMMALMQFPSVVDMMCMEMDWTTELGSAFQADEPGVLEAVQRLRKQAAEMGNLKSSEQMKVTTEEQNSEQVIVVQPANPEVVYVPQYNPTAVYTTPATTATTTTVTDTGYSGGEMIATGLLSFGAGMLVNEVFSDDDDDDDYYSPNWGYGGGSGYYPPPYQPRYGNGFRPANGYNRPPNYQHGFNNNNIYVNADGKDYFNKFEGGRNNYRKNTNSPISAARPNRPELGELNQRAQSGQRPAPLGQGDGRKVQGNYAGAKPGARQDISAQRPSVGNKVPTGSYAGAKPGARPNTGAQRPTATSKVPKGTYAGAANPAARQKLNPQTAGARDRGRTAAPAAKPALGQQRASKPSAPATATRKAAPKRTSGFEGARNSGKQERAASQRGRASKSHSANRPERTKSGQQRGRNR